VFDSLLRKDLFPQTVTLRDKLEDILDLKIFLKSFYKNDSRRRPGTNIICELLLKKTVQVENSWKEYVKS